MTESGKVGLTGNRSRNPLVRLWRWYFSWAIPGLGMFSEAYIIFSIGLIKPLQAAEYPTCFKTHSACSSNLAKVENYVLLVGIIVGMLVFGVLGDLLGRRRGSRLVAAIMLTGAVQLTFSPFITNPATYLNFFIWASTWYGFGVGGEYPMASSSAAERSEADDRLRHRRGEQVVLVFSGQGMGNLVNSCVILICMAIFGLTGTKLNPIGARNVISLQFAVITAVLIFLTLWRWFRLKESKVWEKEVKDFETIRRTSQLDLDDHTDPKVTPHAPHSKLYLLTNALSFFWPRLLATSLAWVCNDFAFYGNKLFQSTFIALLYPEATEFQRMQWVVLNNAVSLTGYWAAAYFIDKRWYGRRRMQNVGFIMMFVLFLICGVAFPQLRGSTTGLHVFQFLYFFSSFWNQFGPNCTTWLVAAEVFPTDVRATFQGTSAAMGKVGAIIADVVFGYVSQRTSFYLSAAFGILGAAVTWLFLPDTTGMSLDELDRMAKHMLVGEFEHYRGEAINPRHLSIWERWVWRWGKRYDPATDAERKALEMESHARQQAKRAEHVFNMADHPTGNVAPLNVD